METFGLIDPASVTLDALDPIGLSPFSAIGKLKRRIREAEDAFGQMTRDRDKWRSWYQTVQKLHDQKAVSLAACLAGKK